MACPVTIHAVLHIVDYIIAAGPVWTSWAFPMERYCGHVSRNIRSRRFPWSNINEFVLASARLAYIKIKFNCIDELRLGPNKGELPQGSVKLPLCMHTPTSTDQSKSRD